MVGKRCVWENNFPRIEAFKGIHNRIYEILSVTLTHVYIKNVRSGLGDAKNVPLKTFASEYIIIEPNSQ